MTIFTLDEQAATEDDFAEQYPVEDDHSAVLAIDAAVWPSDGGAQIITSANDWELAADVLANLDGALDGYRVLVKPPDWPCWLAGEADSVPNPYQPDGSIRYPDTLDVLSDVVTEANRLAAFAQGTRSEQEKRS